ncbi:hypothetical protein [Ectobacillus ponti]|uniref:Uncharacterized protein n=1 Tax=Ectobacillus ponti TaxID=2961894 RepID=A0AA41XAG3_9BACI|nr:hypothetical protein [Ectobacillus ponti]MCP8969248.1 hypothetical protein [Ectobacillus ponti]
MNNEQINTDKINILTAGRVFLSTLKNGLQHLEDDKTIAQYEKAKEVLVRLMEQEARNCESFLEKCEELEAELGKRTH